MRYYAGYAESFYYAYIYGPEAFARTTTPAISSLDGGATKMTDVERINLEQQGILAAPASGPGSLGPDWAGRHPLVSGEGNRHKYAKITRHAWNSPIPPNAFALVGSGLYVSTPEFTFLQLSRELSPLALALVGCALCASYRLDVQTGQIVQRQPLTSVALLRSFIEQAQGVRGKRNALRALDMLADGAESPQEVNLFLLASLPVDAGGSAIGDLNFNYEVGVEERDAPILDRATRTSFRIDMGVPSRGVGIEYLGKHHELQLDQDRERQNALLSKGQRILQAKYQDISNPILAERLICQLSVLLGREAPERTPAQELARARLLDALFGVGRLQL